MGAGGRDFHDFNTVFRDHAGHEVVVFTAAEIPDIDDRRYPASLAGSRTGCGKSQTSRAIADARLVNPRAAIVRTASPVALDAGPSLEGRRVLVVEDGPSITHGGIADGAGAVAARAVGPASSSIPDRPPPTPACGVWTPAARRAARPSPTSSSTWRHPDRPDPSARHPAPGAPRTYRSADVGSPTLAETITARVRDWKA